MSTEQNTTVVRRFFEEFNKQDFSAWPQLCSPEYVLDFPGGPGTRYGLDGLRDATREFAQSFPDLCFMIEDLIAEGDQVACAWSMTAHQSGPLGPIPPTGKPVALTGTSFLTLKDGKIVHDRVRADMLGVLGQIGALPPAG